MLYFYSLNIKWLNKHSQVQMQFYSHSVSQCVSTLSLSLIPEHFHDFTLDFYDCPQWCTITAFADAVTIKRSAIVSSWRIIQSLCATVTHKSCGFGCEAGRSCFTETNSFTWQRSVNFFITGDLLHSPGRFDSRHLPIIRDLSYLHTVFNIFGCVRAFWPAS